MNNGSKRGAVAVAFGTLGIVFGDIGTSPLYALRESFEHSRLPITADTVYGIASVVFWSLVVVISLKYLVLVMRADNDGEGGILALTALVIGRGDSDGQGKSTRQAKHATAGLVALGVFGTALLYGDGLITPAISVLSAVEGFEVASSAFADWVVPVAVAILVALFAVQRSGTARIAKVFSPVMLVWFTAIGALGLRQIVGHPEVLRALSPTYAVTLFIDHPWRAFLALGSVFLVVTGGEALYADMGHFGRRPITVAWYTVALPGLLLNYLGQAALIADGRAEVGNPFYELAPTWAVTPLAILATMATVIASQALISGAFSLTAQAMQLDYIPRLAIRHTSAEHVGQVYVPLVNWLLMIGCVALAIAFRTSSALAAAYGIAVTTTMLITTIVFYRVVRYRWGWARAKSLIIIVPFGIVDILFLGANIPKIPNGGWFPLVVGAGLAIQMTTWRTGRRIVGEQFAKRTRPCADVIADAVAGGTTRVPGTAIYMSKRADSAAPALVTNLAHYSALHETVLLVAVETVDRPYVGNRKRTRITKIGPGVFQVRIEFGFREAPDVPAALRRAKLPDLTGLDAATYFLGDESIMSGFKGGMHPWREHLFALLDRAAADAARFFHLPPEQVVTIGTRVVI